jgi:hypothetical protein
MPGKINLHPFDANLMFRTTGDLTQDESKGPLTVYGGIKNGLAAQIIVPSSASIGADDKLEANVYRSSDGSTYNLVSQYAEGIITKPSTDGAVWIVPFPVLPGKNYVKLELKGTATTFNFGAVVAGIIPNPGFDYDRTHHWE